MVVTGARCSRLCACCLGALCCADGWRPQDVDGEMADELMAAAPGLFERTASGKLRANSARGHEQHLEKVGRHRAPKGRLT